MQCPNEQTQGIVYNCIIFIIENISAQLRHMQLCHIKAYIIVRSLTTNISHFKFHTWIRSEMMLRGLLLRTIILLQMSTNCKVVSPNQTIAPHQPQNLSPTMTCIQRAIMMNLQAMIHTPSIKHHHLQGHRYEHHSTIPHLISGVLIF